LTSRSGIAEASIRRAVEIGLVRGPRVSTFWRTMSPRPLELMSSLSARLSVKSAWRGRGGRVVDRVQDAHFDVLANVLGLGVAYASEPQD
jgi:hypothetical protein